MKTVKPTHSPSPTNHWGEPLIKWNKKGEVILPAGVVGYVLTSIGPGQYPQWKEVKK